MRILLVASLLLFAGCFSLTEDDYSNTTLNKDFTRADELAIGAADFGDHDLLVVELFSKTDTVVDVLLTTNLQMLRGATTPVSAEPSSPPICSMVQSDLWGIIQISDLYGVGSYNQLAGQEIILDAGDQDTNARSEQGQLQLKGGQPKLLYLGLGDASYWAGDPQSSWDVRVVGDAYHRVFALNGMDCGIRPVDFDEGTWSDVGYVLVAQNMKKTFTVDMTSLVFVAISADIRYNADFYGPEGLLGHYETMAPTAATQAGLTLTGQGEYRFEVTELQGDNGAWPTFAAYMQAGLPSLEESHAAKQVM